MMYRCKFNAAWCNQDLFPHLASWVAPDENDETSAKCLLCKTKISLATMGVTALTRHLGQAKHKNRMMSKQGDECLGMK